MISDASTTGTEAPGEPLSIPELYGENVFSIKVMRDYLSDKAYRSLVATIRDGRSLDPGIADEVADAMKTWAIAKGATHFTHWFQPLTGATAEKHDSFIDPDREGGVVLRFSSKELIKGEPDASSFPSGGLRATFEARGYTAWDPTSPAFIKEGDNGATLCIPTVFCGYHGEALDRKTPLLRSVEALCRQVARLAALFGITTERRAIIELGVEQEYFLVDHEFYQDRLDLLQAGRTLFGRAPAKHQQMEDHYFGAIKRRVMAFMEDLDCALWRLGIPAKTRHNEVSPGQFEIAPVYEELNLAIDHNMLVMETLRDVAVHHGFACLLHEKPFAGVNGSGKHMNWNITGPDGENWMKPGDNPHEDARFLAVVCAVLKAVDTHAALLRAAVATAGNDHRLGANEAPPAIMSVFLGDQLTGIIEQIEAGGPKSSKNGGILNIGVSSLPPLPRDSTDRNRTSPFAFTGNKFEFRAVGSNMSCSAPSTVLNTIVAEALDELCSRLEESVAGGTEFNTALQAVLQATVRKHKRIIFNGDNYSAEWRDEARKRGLPIITTTPEALEVLKAPETTALFDKHGVLSPEELASRYEVFRHEYGQITQIEAECAATIARTMILPNALRYQGDLATTIKRTQAVSDAGLPHTRALLEQLSGLCEQALAQTNALEAAVDSGDAAAMIAALAALRVSADALEAIVPDDMRPLPSYAEMMFML